MKRTIVVFTKQDCPNCPQAKKVVEEYGKKHKDIKTLYYDVGTVDGLAESAFFDVFSTPTVLVIEDDIGIKRLTGNINEEMLDKIKETK